jgi:diguanylate cyclase (GGDEF)-like protein
LGAVDYIYKPVNNEILKSKVRVFIRLNEQNKIIEAKTRALEEKIIQLEIAEKKLNLIARIDTLTEIFNRRGFDEEFIAEWYRAVRQDSDFSLLMIDIDNFKLFNDTYGHLKGDECLKSVANAIKKSLKRPFDEVARYGGEEFVVLLPETNRSGAIKIAEDIRKNVMMLEIENQHSKVFKYITVSIGISCIKPTVDIDRERLLMESDKALYLAKESGKNRFEVHPSE